MCPPLVLAEVLENRPLEGVVAYSPTLEESFRRATTQKRTVERGLTQISRAGNPKRQLPDCQAGPTASSTPLLLDAQMPWGGHPLCGWLWVSVLLPPKKATQLPEEVISNQRDLHQRAAKGRDPKTLERAVNPSEGIAACSLFQSRFQYQLRF